MTSEVDVAKTNEFLRRRKLRLQQVREQSKDIAKKIRQRAKVEKLRHGLDVDAKKEKEYFECQEKLVKRLELLYSKSLQNVGSSHKNALEVSQRDVAEKIDLSKLRGKEAVNELRKRKQEKLDEQKKILDRKLHARELANEISREKSLSVAKNLTKQTKKSDNLSIKLDGNSDQINDKDKTQDKDSGKNPDVTKADMATQWEFAELPNEWEPNIPALSLHTDDTVKDIVESTEKSDKNKRPNLFALSDEMPSSLRGGLTSAVEETVPVKNSLTLVSEYLQSRNLKLREFESVKRPTEDLQSIKQTILRTRASSSRPDGTKGVSARSTEPEITLSKKKSISVYNHNTRDIVDVPYNEDSFVVQDKKSEDDAYAQALQETKSAVTIDKEQLNKRQKDMRNKIAVTRHNVDKEYRDTLAFLNSLPKDTGSKPVKTTYMDDNQQQLEKDKHQRKMQLEFKKIERECRKQNCKHNKRKTVLPDRNTSKAPVNNDKHRNDFEYSWMPVPEGDGGFAIHTIPTTIKKSGNTVKFSEPNTYHEYRSRHKHTPPTKENDSRQTNIVESLVLQTSNESDDHDASETSSVENLNLDKENTNSELRDAERIIIYKVLDSRKKKRNRKKTEAAFKNSKSASSNEIGSTVKDTAENRKQKSMIIEQNGDAIPNGYALENLQEGIYKGVSNEGDNITSMYFSENPQEGVSRSRQDVNLRNTCCCINGSTKAHNTDLQNEGADTTSRATKAVCSLCGNKSSDISLQVQPSAATSTTSFKTAPNDKTNFPTNPDSGFIKMVDEGGQETGKFYIGASGFIKDDNYEVVIQLRKKEAEKAIITENKISNIPMHESEKPNVPTAQNNDDKFVEKADLDSSSKSIKEKASPSIPSNVTIYVETNKEKDSHDNMEQHSLNKEFTESNVIRPKSKSQTNTCEKAVHTSFEDTYAIPVNVPKSDPFPRPATSTYTQTSFNSSLQRPAFMHMSSSTSTAYMSPPELVVPNFLKQDHILTHDELFESENTVNNTDTQYEVIEKTCEEYECKCKNCTCVKNVKCKLRNATSTPPNTARSCNRSETTHEIVVDRKRKCKCNKCSKHGQTKVCHKSHRKLINSETTRSSRDVPSEYKDNKHVLIKHRSSARSVCKKEDGKSSEINPVVKSYVNKLLSLNEEGLKAIEIINQDCSIASTPSSSIINIPSNKDVRQTSKNGLHNKISLEQIKNILKDQILKENYIQCDKNIEQAKAKTTTEYETKKIPKSLLRLPKKKSVHKVKSLNISRQLLNKKKLDTRRLVSTSKNTTSTSSSTREEKKIIGDKNNFESRCKSSPTPRSFENSEYKNSTSSDIAESTINRFKKVVKKADFQKNYKERLSKDNSKTNMSHIRRYNYNTNRPKSSYISTDSEVPSIVLQHLSAPRSPTNMSTQTNGSMDVESNFMKLAEGKLQNMEKIADLTEKCTQRLSNLAKVLEEVRKNKSLVYSQISTSDSASETENKSDKNETTGTFNYMAQASILNQNKETQPLLPSLTLPENIDEKNIFNKESFTPILKDIPKPNNFLVTSSETVPENDKTIQSSYAPIEPMGMKTRGRPPPALSRINLKNGQDFCVTPHELSTVLEVDSPMSLKLKNQSSRQDTKLELPEKSNQITDINDNNLENITVNPSADVKEPRIDPDLLQSNAALSRYWPKISTTDSSDDSKIRTMDLKQFNDIMLKPFISLQEYAKQCNIGLDEGSNIEDVVKDDPVNDELSSLHSDGSLPDVIAELLKRKMISEPFRFDSASNVNSTTLSSESTLSILALSKRKHKRKSEILQKNKESIGETTETLSISSNPDLENAFQKLGMGWASSTLKKTKERLALSSSSNTSSSSLTQFKIRAFSQDVPTFVTDSTSSLFDVSNKPENKEPPERNVKENSKNAVQQTSLINSMTIKEFLTNELGKKITFSNKTTLKDADDEFMSLYETNIPDNMKNTNVGIEQDDDQSVASATNNRARTSTPVQIYKSTTYHSTSSSNASNGLFSNADELSSVKVTSTSIRNHSTSDKDDLTIPNYTLKTRKELSDYSKSD